MTIPFDLERFLAGDIALTRDGREAKFLFYNENIDVPHVRLGAIVDERLSAYYESGMYESKPSGIDLVAMKPKSHKHKALMDSYKEGQAWQRLSEYNRWENVFDTTFGWVKPTWREYEEFRLHPHNEYIMAANSGQEVQQYFGTDSSGKDIWNDVDNYWTENSVFRIKPKTKTVYEWMYKKKFWDNWILDNALYTDEEATLKYKDYEHRKTARKFEVEE